MSVQRMLFDGQELREALTRSGDGIEIRNEYSDTGFTGQPLTIQRRYEPNPEALDRVVEILYHLLVEPPARPAETAESASSTSATSTCVSGRHEG